MRVFFLVLFTFVAMNLFAQEDEESLRSDYEYSVEGFAWGVNVSKTCEKALKRAMKNAEDLCLEMGTTIGEYKLYGGCGISHSFFDLQERVYEVLFNCE